MVHWLKNHYKADVIHISNALLLGLAHKLKEQLNVPVVCSLQDEHVWVDVMRPAFAKQVWELMQQKARDIDMFVSVSHYYTDFMKDKLKLADDQITTLHLGVDPADYHYVNATDKQRNIGYLSRMCHENGMDILVDAFIMLKKQAGYEDVKLLLTGGQTGDDIGFIKTQKHKINASGLSDFVEFIPDFDEEKRNAFFERIMLLSVPVRNGEAFGIYLTEAMAAGIPIVQPALGAFPEIIKKSQGGVVFQQNDPEHLAEALSKLLNEPDMLQGMSKKARQSIEVQFNIHALSKKMTNIYQQIINR